MKLKHKVRINGGDYLCEYNYQDYGKCSPIRLYFTTTGNPLATGLNSSIIKAFHDEIVAQLEKRWWVPIKDPDRPCVVGATWSDSEPLNPKVTGDM